MKSLLVHHFSPEQTRSYFVRKSYLPDEKIIIKEQQGPQTDQPKHKMQLSIAHDIIIKDLQKQFQDSYTYLNLRFVKAYQHSIFTSSIKKLCDSSNSLGQELTLKKEGTINITNETTVAGLIKEFQDTYGIPVQLCRRSGNLWIEVTLTSDWTLEQQNNHGQEISIQ